MPLDTQVINNLIIITSHKLPAILKTRVFTNTDSSQIFLHIEPHWVEKPCQWKEGKLMLEANIAISHCISCGWPNAPCLKAFSWSNCCSCTTLRHCCVCSHLKAKERAVDVNIGNVLGANLARCKVEYVNIYTGAWVNPDFSLFSPPLSGMFSTFSSNCVLLYSGAWCYFYWSAFLLLQRNCEQRDKHCRSTC